MTLSECIRDYMMRTNRPVSTREITDAMPRGTTMPRVSTWLSVWIRRGLARRGNTHRPYTYVLVDAASMHAAPPRREPVRSQCEPAHVDRPAPSYPANHEARRQANRSALNIHLAIQHAISANIAQVVERLTRDAIRRYVDLMQEKPESGA